jgi:aryl-alcohol dehydrogenase-like predicted oxidoreductase
MTEASSEAMIDLCARQGIGFIPWSPLAFGELARSGGALDQIARRHNAQPGQIALAWLLKRSSTMLPIPGTSRVKHLDEDMVGATIRLSQEEYNLLDEESR